jgi:hypothetical protein
MYSRTDRPDRYSTVTSASALRCSGSQACTGVATTAPSGREVAERIQQFDAVAKHVDQGQVAGAGVLVE